MFITDVNLFFYIVYKQSSDVCKVPRSNASIKKHPVWDKIMDAHNNSTIHCSHSLVTFSKEIDKYIAGHLFDKVQDDLLMEMNSGLDKQLKVLDLMQDG